MITDVFPVGVMSPGNNLVIVAPTLTTPTAPKLTDAAGATSLDLTDYIKNDGWDMKFDQERNDDTRMGDSTKRETFGVATVSQDAITHIVDPQDAGTTSGNKALSTLVESTTVYVIVRMGKPRGTALAVGDIVDVYQVALGKASIVPLASGKYMREIKTSFTRVANRVAMVA